MLDCTDCTKVLEAGIRRTTAGGGASAGGAALGGLPTAPAFAAAILASASACTESVLGFSKALTSGSTAASAADPLPLGFWGIALAALRAAAASLSAAGLRSPLLLFMGGGPSAAAMAAAMAAFSAAVLRRPLALFLLAGGPFPAALVAAMATAMAAFSAAVLRRPLARFFLGGGISAGFAGMVALSEPLGLPIGLFLLAAAAASAAFSAAVLCRPLVRFLGGPGFPRLRSRASLDLDPGLCLPLALFIGIDAAEASEAADVGTSTGMPS
mmetsp:Transcript_116047/g.339312  ORF Transcript_116047/g.339312 Transcript_116047/m.339312 type:complete len:270 (+) Transcript_116047:224-1033(+)